MAFFGVKRNHAALQADIKSAAEGGDLRGEALRQEKFFHGFFSSSAPAGSRREAINALKGCIKALPNAKFGVSERAGYLISLNARLQSEKIGLIEEASVKQSFGQSEIYSFEGKHYIKERAGGINCYYRCNRYGKKFVPHVVLRDENKQLQNEGKELSGEGKQLRGEGRRLSGEDKQLQRGVVRVNSPEETILRRKWLKEILSILKAKPDMTGGGRKQLFDLMSQSKQENDFRGLLADVADGAIPLPENSGVRAIAREFGACYNISQVEMDKSNGGRFRAMGAATNPATKNRESFERPRTVRIVNGDVKKGSLDESWLEAQWRSIEHSLPTGDVKFRVVELRTKHKTDFRGFIESVIREIKDKDILEKANQVLGFYADAK